VGLRLLATAAAGLLFGLSLSERATADILVTIDKSDQRMTVAVDGAVRYVWPVSTGRKGYNTPNGRFRALWMAKRYFSRKYDDAPMPHAIFFHDGYAIHGTEHTRRLGGPASHGCIRLARGNAKILYELVLEHKRANTRIEITGATAFAAEKKKSKSARAERSERRKRARSEERRSRRSVARYWDDRDYYPAPRYGSDSAYSRWYRYGGRLY
jgi:hypothetical protein